MQHSCTCLHMLLGFTNACQTLNSWHMWQAALKRYPDGVPLLDPIEDMNIQDEGLNAAVRAVEELEQQLATNPVWQVGWGAC